MKPAIIDIPGIGPVAAATLEEHGYRKLKKLAATSSKKLAVVPGFSQVRAEKVIASAAELLEAAGQDVAGDKPKGGGKGKEHKQGKHKDKKGKKRKKDKKDKKGKKGKKDKKDKKRKKGKQ